MSPKPVKLTLKAAATLNNSETLPLTLPPKSIRRVRTSPGLAQLTHAEEYDQVLQTLKKLLTPETNKSGNHYPCVITYQQGHPLNTFTVAMEYNNVYHVVGYFESTEYWERNGLLQTITNYENAGHLYQTDLVEFSPSEVFLNLNLYPEELEQLKLSQHKMIPEEEKIVWLAKPKTHQTEYAKIWKKNKLLKSETWAEDRTTLVTLHVEKATTGPDKGKPVIKITKNSDGQNLGQMTATESKRWEQTVTQYTSKGEQPVAEAVIRQSSYPHPKKWKINIDYEMYIRMPKKV